MSVNFICFAFKSPHKIEFSMIKQWQDKLLKALSFVYAFK